MLNYNHLHYFHVAATSGSIATAAQSLGVAQPTVSEQVRALERNLGITLFERTPSGLKLTDAGRVVFDHTSIMFRAAERLVDSLGYGKQDLPRSLRVGLSTAVARSVSSTFLMPLLELEDCLPSLRTGETLALIRELTSGDLDLVLTESEPPTQLTAGVEIVHVERTLLVAVAPPALQPATDWTDVGLVQYRASSSHRWDVEAFLDTNGFRPRILAESDDPLFMVETAVRTGAIAVVPRSVAHDAIAAGRLKVLARLKDSPTGVHALYQQRDTAELARRAVEMLIERARQFVDAP